MFKIAPQRSPMKSQKEQRRELRDRKGYNGLYGWGVIERLERDWSFLWTQGRCQGCVCLRETACRGRTARVQSSFPERVLAAESEAAVGLTSHSLCCDTVAITSLCYLLFSCTLQIRAVIMLNEAHLMKTSFIKKVNMQTPRNKGT